MEQKKRTSLQTLPTVLGNEAIANPADSPLWKKSAIFIGDSICHNKYEQLQDPTTAGWPGRIGTKYEMRWYNTGIGGATVAVTKENNTTVQLIKIKETVEEIDLLVMQGGINDAYGGVALGRVEEGFQLDSFDNTTFAGCLQNLFARAKSYYPEAKFFYILHHTTPSSLMLTDLNQRNIPRGNPKDYIDLACEICEKWGVPYLNLYDDEKFNVEIFDTAHNSKGCMWPDLLHLGSPLGYDTLTSYIVAWLEHCLKQ